MAALIKTEECDIETDEIKSVSENKTITLIKRVENCKPFVTSSISFVGISIILIGMMIFFCLNSENNNLSPFKNNLVTV